VADTLSRVQDRFEIHPVTPDRWDDLLRLFGPNGAYSNCWCTWWVLSSREWEDAGTDGRREALEGLVAEGAVPGLLAYDGGSPVGWVAVGPRHRYARLMSPRSPTFKPLDDAPSWVINCFFIHKQRRGEGIATTLLDAAVRFALDQGATRIEAHPRDTSIRRLTNSDLFVGTLEMFLAAGFTELERRKGRPVVILERTAD